MDRDEGLAMLRAKTTVSNAGCWESKSKSYGHIKYRGESWLCHRLAWSLVNGPIPEGLFICHRCNNKPCCNPEHLYLGTHAQNMRDALNDGLSLGVASINFAKTECIHGHALTEDNVYRTRRGRRHCRKCGREDNRKYRAKRALIPAAANTESEETKS